MKNIVYVDYDEEREQQVMIGKPPEMPQPTNEEEAGEMITDDIRTLTLAVKRLIDVAAESGYGDVETLVSEVTEELKK